MRSMRSMLSMSSMRSMPSMPSMPSMRSMRSLSASSSMRPMFATSSQSIAWVRSDNATRRAERTPRTLDRITIRHVRSALNRSSVSSPPSVAHFWGSPSTVTTHSAGTHHAIADRATNQTPAYAMPAASTRASTYRSDNATRRAERTPRTTIRRVRSALNRSSVSSPPSVAHFWVSPSTVAAHHAGTHHAIADRATNRTLDRIAGSQGSAAHATSTTHASAGHATNPTSPACTNSMPLPLTISPTTSERSR